MINIIAPFEPRPRLFAPLPLKNNFEINPDNDDRNNRNNQANLHFKEIALQLLA